MPRNQGRLPPGSEPATSRRPSDGFTEYRFFMGDPAAGRWGDYGAAVARPGSIWIASEYVGQACSFAIYNIDRTCEGTRTQFANWGTRISRITP